MPRLLLYLIFFFVLISLMGMISKPTLAADPPSPIPSVISNQDDITSLKNEVEKIRDENYQNAITSAKSASDKADSTISTVTMAATILGLGFTTVAIVFGFGVFTVRAELREQLKELKENVSYSKEKTKEMELLLGEAQTHIKTSEDGMEKVNELIQEAEKIVSDTKRNKDQNFKEISKTLADIKREQASVSRGIVSNALDIGTIGAKISLASPSSYVNFGTGNLSSNVIGSQVRGPGYIMSQDVPTVGSSDVTIIGKPKI